MSFSGSPNLTDIVRNDNSLNWHAYRTELQPKYTQVWLDLGFIFAMLISGIAVISQIAMPYVYIAVPFIAMWMGFWLHALLLFFHEAAHFNLASSHQLNDRIARIIFTPFFGVDIALYRKSHWQHHLRLGLLNDTEVSYRSPFNINTILATASGLRTIYAFLHYFSMHKKSSNKQSLRQRHKHLLAFAVLMLMQCSLILLLGYYVSIYASITWVAGQFLFFPFFAWLRQILEHRSPDAKASVDYSKIPHTPFTRIFKTGLIGHYFGAAGFKQHLLHHWDPHISYTRFDEMEDFMLNTDLAELIDVNRSTYWQAFKALYNA